MDEGDVSSESATRRYENRNRIGGQVQQTPVEAFSSTQHCLLLKVPGA
jgi:hypothetical protein